MDSCIIGLIVNKNWKGNMKKVVLNLIAVVLTIVGLGSVATVSPAYADADWKKCVGDPNCLTQTKTGTEGVFGENDLMSTLTTIINVIVGVIGFVSVAMIVLGGISFATSQGDTSKTTKARNTILYGVVGLVVAILAFAIVNFVLTNVFSSK